LIEHEAILVGLHCSVVRVLVGSGVCLTLPEYNTAVSGWSNQELPVCQRQRLVQYVGTGRYACIMRPVSMPSFRTGIVMSCLSCLYRVQAQPLASFDPQPCPGRQLCPHWKPSPGVVARRPASPRLGGPMRTGRARHPPMGGDPRSSASVYDHTD
jgi:hypothetical protein